jgi:hypothetical protein
LLDARQIQAWTRLYIVLYKSLQRCYSMRPGSVFFLIDADVLFVKCCFIYILGSDNKSHKKIKKKKTDVKKCNFLSEKIPSIYFLSFGSALFIYKPYQESSNLDNFQFRNKIHLRWKSKDLILSKWKIISAVFTSSEL